MKYATYPKYKESSIDWIGSVPSEWNFKKLKHCVHYFIGGGTPNSSDETNWTDEDRGIAWVSIADITAQEIISKTENYITKKGLNEKNLKILPKGTIIYSIFASLGKVAELGIDATTNQAILGIIYDEKKLKKNFLKYWLNYMENHIKILSSSNTQDNLNAEKVKNMPLFIPSLKEQEEISLFLDLEVSKIYEIIQKYQQLTEFLKEKRIALISHIVTKGLDPNVKMKDSGVEWVGKIPNHWIVKRLKYIVKINQQALHESIGPDYEMSYLDISNVTRIGQIISLEEMSFDKSPSRARRIPQNKDTIISTVRTYLKAITYLENIPDNLIVSTGFAVLNPNDFIFPKFLYYLTTSEPFVQMIVAESKGVAYPAINPSEIASLCTWYPEIDEQSKIVSYLDIETSKIDTLIQKINKQIDLLNEYKTSLISHVVTGKIDVRDEVLCQVPKNIQ